MSKGSLWAIGSVALLGGGCVLYLAVITFLYELEPPHQAALYALVGVFALAIAAACFVPRSRPLTLRVVGAGVVLMIALLLAKDFRDAAAGVEVAWGRHLLGMLVFGLPALYVTLFGMYPIWGRFSGVFNQEHRRAGPRLGDEQDHP
jgi:hypothetical protein